MIPVITSFLPPSHTHLFLPSLFKIWEAFNSSVVDEYLLELAGELSEGQVSANPGDVGGSEWKDVGIWSETQWKLIVGKGLGSMSCVVSEDLTDFLLTRLHYRCTCWSYESQIGTETRRLWFTDISLYRAIALQQIMQME
jgi:hypothetical protein